MRKCLDPMILQKSGGGSCCVSGCPILEEGPGQCVGPQKRTSSPQGLPEVLQDLNVKKVTNAMPSGYKLLVNYSITIEEHHHH